MILVDSCVLIDVFNRDPVWFAWSADSLRQSGAGASLFVNPVVVGEIGWQFESYDDLRRILASLLISVEALGPEAAFRAASAYRVYRQRRDGEVPKLPLPDFFIGGHAQHENATILTRDSRFYRQYFPDVPLITPETMP
ncbi:type II toxin-antitoxin system VapC family toxin [Novosphingobium colocasiae]|uniref:type II toxin-antitoxin system VapC family toxin n=1 Tax=Novosphingobium colocasiae TaxID=1256513 RepID=UPI0035B12FF9